ncbi:MAG: 50S ribosomal protein L21 [Magnetococcales bacterium]|nr:50S ribosomal protein L21 [Magnetococcales bacterium]PPR16097.1 MAG: 50S ribosomal protein L21 [Pseudomonadota bacterium]|tara:strand:- start:4025 stop:4411 length:387 start_codon:yes stop_codon:yes gene_type:complete
MYAVLKCGGKQIKVSKGDTVLVEKLAGETGEKVTLDNVLLLADGEKLTVGTPVVEGATVTASIVEQIRDKKVIIFKKKRRQGYKRKKGHRQYLTVLKVEEISAKGGKVAPAKAEEKKPAAKKTAAKKA